MTTYLQQKWVLTQCDVEQFAEDQGCTNADVFSAINSWNLFGDGMDIAGFKDDTLRQLFSTMFEGNPHV